MAEPLAEDVVRCFSKHSARRAVFPNSCGTLAKAAGYEVRSFSEHLETQGDFP